MIFLYPVVFNSIIEFNLMISKFSLQAGALRSTVIYNFNDNDVFVQFRKGDGVTWLVNLEIGGRGMAEDSRAGGRGTDLWKLKCPWL